MVTPPSRGHAPQRKQGQSRHELPLWLDFKVRCQRAGPKRAEIRASPRNQQRGLEVITSQHIVVIDEYDELCLRFLDRAQTRWRQSQLILSDVASARVP